MSYPVYTVYSGDVLPVLFDTFDGGTGASCTLTGLAVTDIEIYKDGSTTQRASDAGYTLLDTDGIDFDGVTGIHGFSIDTGDNTDAGFYAVGSWYHVVVSSVTVDSQTVNFIACAFRIMAAEAVAGVPVVDVTHISGDADAANNCELMFDGTGYAGGTTKMNVNVSTITNDAITAASIAAGAIDNATFAADVGSTAYATNVIALATRKALDDYDPPTKAELDTAQGAVTVSTIGAGAITATAIADNAIDLATFAADCKTGSALKANVETITAGAITAAAIATDAIDADAIKADAVAEIADGVWDEASTGHTEAGKAGAQLWTVLNDVPSTSEFEARTLAAADYTIVSDLGTVQTGDAYARLGAPAGASVSADVAAIKTVADGIKTKTDSLTFTVAGQVDANIQSINDTSLTGNGSSGTPWGPA